MRLSREQFFDLVELVGKAIVTARQKPADVSWLAGLAPGWLRKKELEEEPKEDVYGLFSGTAWVEDQEKKRSIYEFSVMGRAKVERAKKAYEDSISCELWQIDRGVRFRKLPVTEGMTQLMELCRRLSKHFISEGWANLLVRILDRASH